MKDNARDDIREMKVFKAMTYLNAYELNRFKKFIESPYFNKNEEFIQLFSLFHQNIKKNAGPLIKSKVWKSLYKDKPYDDLTLRRTGSKLLNLYEKFLAQEVYEQAHVRQANYILESIANKKIGELYNSSIKSAQKISAAGVSYSSESFYQQFLLQKNLYQLYEQDLQRSTKSNLEDISNRLDKFYIIEKLKLYRNMLWRNLWSKTQYNLHFMDQITKQLGDGIYKNDEVITIYYENIQMLLNQDQPEYYHSFKERLLTHLDYFEKMEALQLFKQLINYCVEKSNQGDKQFISEEFSLYQQGIEKDILLIDGRIEHFDYLNIIFIAIREKAFDWAYQFIDQYTQHLDEKYRHNAFTYNMALLKFYQKDFVSVLDHLQALQYSDPTYSINARCLQLASYYELEEYDVLDSFCDSFSTFLSRKKDLPDEHKQYYTNLISYTRKLPIAAQRDLPTMKESIINNKFIASKPWLLEKIEEKLGKRYSMAK